MAPIVPINIRIMRPSTEIIVAAEPSELELKPEPEPESELESEDELESGVDEGAGEEALSGVVVAAELSVVEEAAASTAVLGSAAHPGPEPLKHSCPLPAQKNCTVPQVCPNSQIHSSSLWLLQVILEVTQLSLSPLRLFQIFEYVSKCMLEIWTSSFIVPRASGTSLISQRKIMAMTQRGEHSH